MTTAKHQIEHAKRRGFMLRKTLRSNDPGAEGCWFGGKPTLPPEFDWPTTTAAFRQPSVPSHFLAQIKLDSVPWYDGLPEMPRTGTLFFFVDQVFGPTDEFLNGNARLIYVDRDVSAYPARNTPPGLPFPWKATPRAVAEVKTAYKDNPTSRFRRWNFTFEPTFDYAWECLDTREKLDASGTTWDAEYSRMVEIFDCSHREFVYPEHSFFVGLQTYMRPDSAALTTPAFFPLLAVGEDDDLGFGMHVSDFEIVYWVERKQLKQGIIELSWARGGRRD